MKRFLICNPHGIGDVLFSTPMVRVLKERFPDSFIGYLCNRRTEEILKTNPRLDRLYVYEKDEFRRTWRLSPGEAFRKGAALFRELRNDRFEVLLDLSLAPEFSLLLKWAGIPRRIGLDYKHRGRFLTDRVFLPGLDDGSVSRHYLDTLCPLGIDSSGISYPTELCVTEADDQFADSFFRGQGLQEEVIGIAPGGGTTHGSRASYKQWGASRFARLCDLFQQRRKAKVLLFSAPTEEALSDQLVEEAKEKPVVARGITVRQMASLMKRCRLIVCNDGGPLHVAVSIGRPTVSLFGPTDPEVYGPYPANPLRHAVVSQPVACTPCYQRFKLPDCAQNVCLSWISPETVFAAAQRLLDGKVDSR